MQEPSSPDPAPPAGSRSATLVVSLVEGLEPLQARVPVALERALEELRQTSRRLLETFGGREVPSLVDGWLSVFDSTPAAVRYALSLQLELLDLDWPTILLLRPHAAEERGKGDELLFRGLRVRQGVHLGPVEIRRNRAGVEHTVGPAVHQATRVAFAAHGGQVLLTDAAWHRMRGSLGGLAVLRELGLHALEGVPGVGRLFQVLPEALDARRFPPPRTRDGQRTNLLGRPAPFLGRAADLTSLSALQDLGVRAITVVGPPGVGKSRLVRQHAMLRFGSSAEAGGVWWAEAHRDDPVEVTRAVGHALGLPLVLARGLDELATQVGHALAARGPVVIVLDLPGRSAAPVIEHWLRMAPRARFLLSAPQRLGLGGEVAYELAPLPSVAASQTSDAVRLMALASPEPRATRESEDVPRIAELLGRHPLALELAGGLLSRVDAATLASELEARSGGPFRIVDLVWARLSVPERILLQACAVHPGGFDRLALAERVDPEEVPEPEEALAALRALHLVRPAAGGTGPGWCRLVVHPRVRARVLVHDTPRLRGLRQRMAEHLLALCEPWSERASDVDGAEVVAQLVLERENLLAVVDHGLIEAHSDPRRIDLALRALLVLRPVFRIQGPTLTFLGLLDEALERAKQIPGADALLQVRALVARADVLRRMGRPQQAHTDLLRGRALAESHDDVDGIGRCASSLGRALRVLGQPVEAVEQLEQAREIFARIGARRREGTALGELGVALFEAGHVERAEVALQEAALLLRSIGARQREAIVLAQLGRIQRSSGRWAQATDLFREARRAHRQAGDRRLEAITLLHEGSMHTQLGQAEAAEELLQMALRLAREVGDRRCEAAALADMGRLELERGATDAARQALLEAVALHRELEDRIAEGHDLGWLGAVLFDAGQVDAARASWDRATELLADTPRAALYTGWTALADAWSGRFDPAREGLAAARAAARGEEVRWVLELLGLVVEQRAGNAVPELPDPGPWARASIDVRRALALCRRSEGVQQPGDDGGPDGAAPLHQQQHAAAEEQAGEGVEGGAHDGPDEEGGCGSGDAGQPAAEEQLVGEDEQQQGAG